MKFDHIPGKRTFVEIKGGLIPPLWMWVRLVLFLCISGVLSIMGLSEYAQILLVLAVVSFLNGIFASVCKALANGVSRLTSAKKKK